MGNYYFDLNEDGRYWLKQKSSSFNGDSGKYDGLDLNRPIVFQKQKLDKKSFESIFEYDSTKKICIYLIECSFQYFGGLKFKNAEVHIESGHFNGHLTFEDCTNIELFLERGNSISKFEFLGNSLNVKITMEDFPVRAVKIKNIKELSFTCFKLKSTYFVYENIEFQEIKINESEEISIILNYAYGGHFLLSKVSGGEINILKGGYDFSTLLSNEYHIESIRLIDSKFRNFRISNIDDNIVSLGNIAITNTPNISINRLKVDELHLSGDSLENISISFTEINWLNFDHFKSLGNVVFNVVEIADGSLTLSNSILKDVEMNPSFLHGFSNIFYENSSIEGLKAYSFKLINMNIRNSASSRIKY